VTSIYRWAFCGCESLESISIPDSVIRIGEIAFGYCKSLKNIDIPNSLKVIGKNTFEGCKSLKKITIHSSVMSISKSAFCGCKTIIMYNKIAYPSYVFSSKNTFPFIKEPSYENLMRIKEFLIKARLALDYIDSDTRFVDCVRENCTNLIKQVTENEDWDALDKIFNSEHKLLRPEQLEECLEFAIENKYHELSVLLMQYKENTGNYNKDDNRFDLGL
jgi:hypothetical protein